MCVKEFLGYNCGHCSVPFLRQCPLSLSNPVFPICQYIAERSLLTNEFCHPCSRVVWNMQVLQEEEEHRARHLAGDCMCEVIFEGEDREKRHRTRSTKAKGKGKEMVEGEFRGHEDFDADGEESFPGQQDTEERTRMDVDVAGSETGVSCPRLKWEPHAQMAAYEYVGYYIDQRQPEAIEHQQYTLTVGSYGIQEQLSMGQSGAAIRWGVQEIAPQPLRIFNHNKNFEDILNGPQVRSLPAENHLSLQEALKIPGVPKMPLVVSSDMIRSHSR